MKKKQVLSLLLALALFVSLAACGSTTETAETSAAETSEETTTETEAAAEDETETSESAEAEQTEEAEETEDTASSDSEDGSDSIEMPADYVEASASVYQEVLGEFYEMYETAKEAETTSERFALMALAEAKMLESGVMLPLYSMGGTYALSRVAPYTVDYVLWGTDYDRYHQALVTTEPITTEDRSTMKEKWAELRGTGEYEDWAKSYLEEQGYTLKDEYVISYSQDTTTWDQMSASLATVAAACVNCYDGLLEYDVEGVLQPALAESYEVSDDGLTYTFHLREGVVWVDSQGREVATVTADDFVAGMQHVLDAQGGLEYLLEGVIVNASEYISGEVTDFSEVGVKAIDDYTLEYTLCAPTSYFTTMLGYSIFSPLSRSYYESQGGKFGSEYDESAADYTYGKDPSCIAYCGPYIVTNFTANSTVVYEANESYWNKDNINIHKITWVYNDGSDTTKAYNDFMDGTTDSVSLNTSTVTMAKDDGMFDDYAYTTDNDATSYVAYYNVHRTAYANFNDSTTLVSSQSDEEKERTNAAMMNQNFRVALGLAVDRTSYRAQVVGDDLAAASLRNSYTPGNFVTLEEDTTIEINGVATTFPAGTYYGEIEQAQLDADGYPITVWDPDANDGAGSGDGYDGWYNPEAAKEYLEKAIEELAAEGITVDADNPIQIDLPYPSSVETLSNKVNAYKQSVEASLDGLVQVNLVDAVDYDGWYYAGYYTSYGYESNYDVYDLTGWIPDYGDPCSYLDTMLPDYAGYQTKMLGIY